MYNPILIFSLELITNLLLLFIFQMKPREGFIFLAIVTNIIGVAIAQESLFECPRGKIKTFIIPFFLDDHCYIIIYYNLYSISQGVSYSQWQLLGIFAQKVFETNLNFRY